MVHQLKLYHYWRSSSSWRVRWALAIKGVPYVSVPVNILQGEHRQESYREKNPAGFLPALAIDGRCFGESLAIIDWLEETFPKPSLYPAAPLDRLLARQIALTVASGTQPLQNPSLLAHFVPSECERKGHAQHFIKRGLGIVETLLKDQKGCFCVGNEVSVADICLIPQIYNARRFAVDMTGFPRCSGIYESCLQTKACHDSAPEQQEGANRV